MKPLIPPKPVELYARLDACHTSHFPDHHSLDLLDGRVGWAMGRDQAVRHGVYLSYISARFLPTTELSLLTADQVWYIAP